MLLTCAIAPEDRTPNSSSKRGASDPKIKDMLYGSDFLGKQYNFAAYHTVQEVLSVSILR